MRTENGCDFLVLLVNSCCYLLEFHIKLLFSILLSRKGQMRERIKLFVPYKSSLEFLYSHPPSFSHIRTFVCLCYASCPEILEKFFPRAIPTVLLGYSSSHKGYLLYDIHYKTLFVNRHVVFKEDVFPFRDYKPPLLFFLSSQWSCMMIIPSHHSLLLQLLL